MPRPRGNLARDETESGSHRAGIQADGGDLELLLRQFLPIPDFPKYGGE